MKGSDINMKRVGCLAPAVAAGSAGFAIEKTHAFCKVTVKHMSQNVNFVNFEIFLNKILQKGAKKAARVSHKALDQAPQRREREPRGDRARRHLQPEVVAVELEVRRSG